MFVWGSTLLLSLWQPGRAALDPAKELVFAVSVAKATDTAKRGPSGISLDSHAHKIEFAQNVFLCCE